MSNIFQRRINVWNETKQSANLFPMPIAKKHKYDATGQIHILYPSTKVSVANEDSVVVGDRLLNEGLKPLVLIYADHRFSGGDVGSGRGAQEESLFCRNNLCNGLSQAKFYPIHVDESVIIQKVTVFRSLEQEDYKWLNTPFQLDFIACPGIHNPELDDNGRLNDEDATKLRIKIRCIFQVAQTYGFDSLVLGPLGCGAWRCPPLQVAQIFQEEINKHNGAFSTIVFACLEVKSSDYIVLNRNKESNFTAFTTILGS